MGKRDWVRVWEGTLELGKHQQTYAGCSFDKSMDFLTSRGSRRKGRREVQEAFYRSFFFSSLVTLGCFLARMHSKVLSQRLR